MNDDDFYAHQRLAKQVRELEQELEYEHRRRETLTTLDQLGYGFIGFLIGAALMLLLMYLGG